ncbi:biotin--[acetyl-CoA-carboxylase] ligase [Chloroflexota bacterium]
MKGDLSLVNICRNLETSIIGKNVLYYPCLPSTMITARKEAVYGANEGTVIITGKQTKGRGRMERSWISPEGNIALSVLLYPLVKDLPSLIMMASLAVVYAVRGLTGFSAQIKWPNDILLNGKKVCGILIENNVRGNKVDYAIIGIGLNVNMKMSDFPDIKDTATSLSETLTREFSLAKVTQKLLLEMDRLYLTLRNGVPLYEDWRDKLTTLGQNIRVKSGNALYKGTAELVVSDGSLLLRQADGTLVKIVSGDATLRD